MSEDVSERGSPEKAEQKGLMSQVVETQLLPPERFNQGTQAELLEISEVDGYIAVLKNVKGHHEVGIYDPAGNLTEANLDPSSHNIAKMESSSYLSAHKGSGFGKSPTELLKKLGYVGDTVNEDTNKWIRILESNFHIDSSMDVSKNAILNKSPIYLTHNGWELEKKVDKTTGKKYFVFSLNDTHFSAPASNEKHSILTSQTNDYSNLTEDGPELPGGIKVRDEGNTVVVRDKDGKVLTTYSGSGSTIDPINHNNLYFINTGSVYKLDLSGVPTRTSQPVLNPQIQIEDPKKLDFDPNGNFLVARTGTNKLIIVDRESGEKVSEFDGVKGPFIVDNQGDILFVDTENRLREIQTNFQAIPAGGIEAARQRRDEELRKLQERFAGMDLGKIERVESGTGLEQAVANTLRENLSRQVTNRLSGINNPAEIENILDSLQVLRSDPANKGYGEVIDEFVGQAKERLSGIRTIDLEDGISLLINRIEQAQSVGDTMGLDEQYAKLLELRQKVEIINYDKRREIEQKIRTLQTQKELVVNRYQEELVKAIEDSFPGIEGLIKETGSSEELASLGTTSQAQQFELMLANVRSPEARRALREKYTAAKSEHRSHLEERGRQLEEQQRMRWAQVIEETRQDLDTIREQLAELADLKAVGRFDRHPLVTTWRAKLYGLPPEIRELEEKKLEVVLTSRKRDLEHRKDLGTVSKEGELKFGKTTFPIYKEPPRVWGPKFVPREGGFSTLTDLVFEDSQGRLFKPDPKKEVVVVPNPEDPRTKEIIEKYRVKADEYFKGVRRRVPEFDEHWRITEYHMQKMEEIAETLKLQMDNHRGILILQGEAGTGKNVMVDMLANLSNREVVPILCNENSVKEDLTYEFYYDPERGTYKLPSKLVEALQTPGSVILFDEINALKPGIAKMLNSLFDYRRRIYLPEGGKESEIIVDPSVVFIGTMNPQNYVGVNRLSPEVKSRARVIDVDYPPFEEVKGGRTHYQSHEAEMLAAHMDVLSDLKQNEFRLCWDYVVNNDRTNGAEMILNGNAQLEKDIRRIYDVIRVANNLRRMYEAYQIGDSNEPMDFPTSLREVTDIAMEMNHRKGVSEIIKRVIPPKIDDRRQKRMVEQAIDATLSEELNNP